MPFGIFVRTTIPKVNVPAKGRRLIEAVYDLARKEGASRVYWLTHETNDTARALYDQLADRPGFIQYRKIL